MSTSCYLNIAVLSIYFEWIGPMKDTTSASPQGVLNFQVIITLRLKSLLCTLS